MMIIKLKSGRQVRVDDFEMGHTYDGLFQGSPNEEIGGRKGLKIKPDERNSKRH